MNPFHSTAVKEKRWLWLDYDKGISILLVGYGHCLAMLTGHVDNLDDYTFFNYIGSFMYGFRMPLFFIVSGMLVGRSLEKKGLLNYIGDRTNNILYPLLIWGSIEITLQIIAARYTPFINHDSFGISKYLKLLIDPRATGHFWYLNTLFCIGVIYATLRSKIKFNPFIQIILGLLLYMIYTYTLFNNIDAGLLTDICKYYFFFALGDLASKVMLDQKNRQVFAGWKVLIPLMTVFIIMQYFFTSINLQHSGYGNQFVEHEMPYFYLCESLIGCAASMSFSFMLQKYELFSWIRSVGRCSLFIYLMQIIVMSFVRIFFQNFLHITYVPALILLVWFTGTALPIVIYNFCIRYGLWWLFTFKKPREPAMPVLA